MIRIVIADDHELIREGVKKIIRSSADLRIVGEAADLARTLALVAQHQPDVVVLDISLPEHDGLEGLAELRRQFPEQKVVMLSMYAEERYAVSALRAGAAGYITKAMAAEELVKAIRQVVAGSTYIGPRLAELLARQALDPEPRPSHHNLTAREAEIVALIGAGKQVKQVAAELGISVSSVNTYRNRIFRKMGLSSNAAVIRYALKSGLVS
ncbi:response regulator transcription factor [Massilia sp. R2A-15]|uniref:response regulator n=1 Tax=Massilia sp. R2A-15 TaxID=3064278 RepID=UPI002734EA96|nr:response regulator transcription factor [Massilia sp. R2A-15]WLI91368.1 response regulator transcription factor [Massilia sp. R2A-15]